MRNSTLSGLVVIVAAVLLASPAGADGPQKVLEVDQPPVVREIDATRDLFLSQAPNESNGIFSDVGCDICGNPQILADNFQVISGGMGIDVDTITVWGGYYPGNVPIAAPFEVVVYPDAGGVPGAATCSEILAPTSSIATGVVLFGVDEYQVTIDLVGDCILYDGNYFIQINTDTGPATDDWFWEVRDVDPVYGIVGSIYAFEYPPAVWNADAENSFALQINGTIVPVELQSISVE